MYSEESTQKVLSEARETYGNKNQIFVCIEELNELACVLAKFPRYDKEKEAVAELYSKALDEVADVSIILNHVKSIFGITEEALGSRVEAKLDRLNRWLSKSNSMQQTVEDRAIGAPQGCSACWYSYDSNSPTCKACNGEDPCYHA